ncbi:MAG: hypothetical protein COB15_05440 [Flavobacteriales bacterium]|nr:MAG: hypothetical protein COB15_05440 [Flavobacteriales bacterium]
MLEEESFMVLFFTLSNVGIQLHFLLRCVGEILALADFSSGSAKMWADSSNETQRYYMYVL